jgi:hypothetical protein
MEIVEITLTEVQLADLPKDVDFRVLWYEQAARHDVLSDTRLPARACWPDVLKVYRRRCGTLA